ncbi:DUF4238 domain-containing protein [Paenibacillus sp. KR2-11]|uniref:DUF4238 domain-containing protein n=1 Tax=Paenibacillus sp. KR2-11 TaxID=3385500 RepID=UPI0038FC00AD
MEKRDHHYIPQFYLRNFTDPNPPPKFKPYVWVIDLKEKTLRKRSPKNIGFIKGFNDTRDEDGNVTTIVEDKLGEIENKAAIILKKLLNGKYISRSERLAFAKFVFSMRIRVPYFKDLFSLVLTKPEYTKQFSDLFYDAPPPSPILDMGGIIRTTNAASYVLLRMNWCLIKAPEGKVFVTSDNPMLVIDSNNTKAAFVGFNKPDVQIIFPLSPSVLLKGGWQPNFSLLRETNAEWVQKINSLLLLNAQRYVYMSTGEVEDLFS